MSITKQDQKLKISQVYQVGDFIDAKDNQGDWRVGFIVDKSEITKTFKVRFDGWPSKYDEFYRFGHPKLKQFRSIVLGYTGQKQLPALRPGWKFSLEELENKLVDMHAYVAKNNMEKVKTAHEFNQWIRGHNYLYVDFLMTLTYTSIEQIHKVIQFFKLNISLCVKYLKQVNENFDKFILNIERNNNQHLDDIEVANSWAFYQIFDMAYTICGGYQRMAAFFKDNNDLLKKEFEVVGNRDIKPAYQVKIVEFFYRNGGFELIDQLTKKIFKLKKSVPFMFLYSIAHLYAGVSCAVQAKSRQTIVNQFKQITDKSLQYLGDKQMKDFSQHEVVNYINQILAFSKKTTIEQNIENWAQVIEMEVYFKMITCPYFEKKLKGITSLQELIEKNVDTKKQEDKADLIADGTLVRWIQQRKLFDVLFSQDNPQLIKKSTQLIKYLYHRDNEMQRYIGLVWKYREGKHQTALKQIYTFMGEIPNYDKNESFTVLLFNQHLSKVDQSHIDAEYIKMVKDYTVNALNNVVDKEVNVRETFGFRMIYNYLQKNQDEQILLSYLIQILEKMKETLFLKKFIVDCFLSIGKAVHPKFHVTLLLKILREKLTDLRTIKLDCRVIVQQNIIESKNSQTQNLEEQFQLLNQYLKQAKEIIPEKDFILFWNQMIDSKGRVQFFKWLYKVRDSGRVILTNFINLETKQFLLQNFWSDQYLQQHKMDQYEATFLLQLFKVINDKQDRIKRTNLIIEVVDENLTGIEKLHAAYLQSTDFKASEILAKGLTEIYTCGSQSLIEMNINLLQDFIQRIVILVRQYSDVENIQGVKKMIRLIQELIFRDQEVFDVVQKVRMDAGKNIIVKNLENKEEKILRFNLLVNVYGTKKIIAEKFNLSLNKFDLIINEEEVVGYKSYFEPLGEVEKKGKILLKYRPDTASTTKLQLNHHLQLLFELLGNKSIEQRVWNIVSKLPISDEIREKILHSQNPLEILSNVNSLYKQLYMFKAALSIPKKWWTIDIEQMIKFFLTRLQSTKGETEIEREYIMVAGKLLQNVIKEDVITDDKLLSATFLSVFDIVKRIITQPSDIANIVHVKKFLQTFFVIGEQLNSYLAKNSLMAKQADALSLMLNDPDIEQIFKLCLIEYKHEAIRRQFPARLALLTKYNKEKYATRLASIVLDELLDATAQSQNRTLSQYIQFGCFVLQSMDGFLKSFYAQKKSQYFVKLYKLIESQQPQRNSETINLHLQCYLSMIRYVLKEVSPEELQKFFIYLYTECLFKGNESKCKSKETRNCVFIIFIRLIKSNKVKELIYDTFSRLHRNGLWRTRRLEDWTITHTERLKSPLNYVGLRNLGCICYMNSFFQQIFMIQEFRNALLLADDPQYTPQTVDDNLLYQVKKMFLNLLNSDKKAYNPKSFCLSFKDYEGNPTNVNEQMDIDQFSGILFDRLESQLKATRHASLIKDTFGGIYSNEIICKGCPHFSQSEESFLSLSLTVKDKRSIYESLETMIKGDTLDGDNAYHCERCDKKVSAVKRVCLKKLPNYLMVALKRFQFDYNTMTKQKLNGFCEFPPELNLQEYSYEHLRKRENQKDEQEQQLKSKKYYQYKLKGVVIHIGYADSGHYYSLIQERSGEQRWIEFNDTIVRKFNIDNLNDEAFGGETGGLESKEKIKNAYLLIYERVEKIDFTYDEPKGQAFTDDGRKIQTAETFIQMDMYKEALQTIQKENFEYNIESVLFSAQYVKFIQSLIEESGRNKGNLPLQKFIIMAFLTIIVRSKTNPDMFDILRNVYNSCCKGNQQLCEFVLQQFCDGKIYEQLFRNCPIREIKRNLAAWTCLLIDQVKDEELRERFLGLIVSKISKDTENNFEVLTILHNLADKEYCYKFLIRNNMIGRLFQNIIRKQPRYFTQSIDNIQLQNAIETQSYWGYQQVIQRSAFELKKMKYDNQTGYVWALVYKLIQKFTLTQLATILHPKQLEYLYLSRDKIYKLLQEAKSKFDIDVLTSYLSYLSRSNLEFTQMLIELIEKGLKEFQSKRYRQFFQLFAKLIKIEDQNIYDRLVGIFNIVRSLKENQKYAMDCTIIELWVCKVVSQNQALRNYLTNEKNILKYLAELPLKKLPSEELSKKNINFTETSVNKFHGIPFPPSRRGYIKLLRHVEHFYQKLIVNEYEPIHVFESGPHMVYDKLAPGDKIAYFDVKDKVDYEEAVVKEVFVDKLLILRKGPTNKPFWIWADDEKLTANLKVIRDQNSHELDSSKTTQMEDEIDFEAVN